jgi:hypothetical protein
MAIAKNLDLILLALALPLFVLADLPMLGYVAGGGVYLAQRAIAHVTTRRAAASNDPRTFVGLMAGSMIGRGWLVALTIFAVGMLANKDDGLAAGVLFLALFTAYFTVQMVLRPLEKEIPSP